MAEINRKVAGLLLQSKAIILEPAKPFTWASGWKSPIYCDNRVTLSYPEIRNYIKEAFTRIIEETFPSPDLVAGVATGAIAQGVLVAEAMNLPFVYVRPSVKGHGRQNLIEGRLQPGQKVVVVEDLISTGGSSLKAVDALRQAGAEVAGMVAIFSYGFQVAEDNFRDAKVALRTLTDYHTLIETALESGDIQPEQVALLQEWRKNPSQWKGESKKGKV
ncbi:MAG: orotate phosphoribosyltransferase [Bacteroidia bacterium]|nr:MAG: orotate phosphoribosyltransferase [Bacteroidia bacterium]